MLIDEYLSDYDVTERHSIAVHAPVEQVYVAVRKLDLSGSLTVRLLFRLRELPAWFKPRNNSTQLGLTLEGLLRSGFILLAENPPREIVLGLVGRFWTVSGCIQKLDGDGFKSFSKPGFAKAAWNFSLIEHDANSTLLSTETRVKCTDSKSRKRFRFYWTFIRPFSGLIRRVALREIRRQAESAFKKNKVRLNPEDSKTINRT